MAKILIDREVGMHYEFNGIFKNIIDFFFVPILNNLPKSFQRTVKKTHKSAKELVETATSYNALEILYGHGRKHKSKNWLQGFFRYVWFTRSNAKGVRNRLKLVEREIRNFIQERIDLKEKETNILSIASGSARAIAESLSKILISKEMKVKVSFLDKNPEALKYSQWLVKEEFDLDGLGMEVRWLEDTASSFTKYFDQKLDLIEMVGLLDYFDDDKAESLFRLILNNLSDTGVFITANIMENKERKFVEKIVGWNMIYRKPEELLEIAIKAGFDESKINIYQEPLKIHFVMVAKK